MRILLIKIEHKLRNVRWMGGSSFKRIEKVARRFEINQYPSQNFTS